MGDFQILKPGHIILRVQKVEESLREKDCESLLQEVLSTFEKSDDKGKAELLKSLQSSLPLFYRLAVESPFLDVQISFQKILDQLEKKFGLKVSSEVQQRSLISYFYSAPLVPLLDRPDLRNLFEETFLQFGRVSHLDRLLAAHPSYLEKYRACYSTLMLENGPLPLSWRNYLGIIAAARHNCHYLVSLQEQEFIRNNGESNWLQGLDHSPRKIQNLLPLVELLAHQPWLVTVEHIAVLCKGADSWSKGELIHAIAIIATFVSLSGVVFGCGVALEMDANVSLDSYKTPQLITDEKTHQAQSFVKQVVSELKKSETAESPPTTTSVFEKSVVEDEQAKEVSNTGNSQAEEQLSSDLLKYIGNHKMRHKDFEVKKVHRIYRYQDYTWNEEAYSLLSMYYEDIAPVFEDEFDHTYNMTYNMLGGEKEVDTTLFRTAVWYYVHYIQGILHDDFEYNKINKLLTISMKRFIKKAVCSPDAIVFSDIATMGFSFEASEKIHLTLIAIEARKQAVMLSALKAITAHALH